MISCTLNKTNQGGLGYLKDSTLTTFDGRIIDSNRFSLPIKYYKDITWIDTKIDSFDLKIYSLYLSNFNAPILYNYYLGYDNYRFLWIRSFHCAVLITLEKKGNITINTKILKTRPNIWTTIYNPFGKKNSIGEKIMTGQDISSAKKEYPFADSIVLPKSKVAIALDTTCILSKSQWDRFVGLVDSCEFWKLNAYNKEMGCDGAEWLLEGQNAEKYHFVTRWSPNDMYMRCCEYLIKLSAAKNERIY